MITTQLALILAAAFAGAAFYINSVEQPARLTLDDRNLLKQWKPSYDAGYTMQSNLALFSGMIGLAETFLSGDLRCLLGAVLILANWPYTLIVIMPVNKRLNATAEEDANAETRATIEKWARLHSVRTALGIAATLAYLWALN